MGLWSRIRRLRPPRRLRLTREGRYFVAITLGIGLAAVNTGNNLLYLLLGWLLSMIIASGVLSETALRRLKVSRHPPPQLHAGRPFLMEISVENGKRHLASYSIEIEDLVDGRALDKKCYFLKVPAGRQQRTSYRHTFHRRGLYHFDNFRIATKFPFALFIKSRLVGELTEVIVFPEVRAMPPPAPRAQNLGETAHSRIGRRGEFFGLREYREGDDRRAIHWRSSARTARMLVREYEEEAQRRVTLFCDNSLAEGASAADEEALEHAISLTASLASSYVHLGYQVRLVARGAALPFSAGPAHLVRILRALALLETVTVDVPFAAATERRGENIMILPRTGSSGSGSAPGPRPAAPPGVTHVLEAG